MKTFKLFCILVFMAIWSLIEIPYTGNKHSNTKIGQWLIDYYDGVESGSISTLPIYHSYWFLGLAWVCYSVYVIQLPKVVVQTSFQYWINFSLFISMMLWSVYLLIRYRDSIKD